jgi:hypothetical protein
MDNKQTETESNYLKIPTFNEREINQQGWQAVCNAHAGGWYGNCWKNEGTGPKNARQEADTHDKNSHRGEKYAVVVRRTCN